VRSRRSARCPESRAGQLLREHRGIGFRALSNGAGIEALEDRMLQGDCFAMPTHRCIAGSNYNSLPVNRPPSAVDNEDQDGTMNSAVARGDQLRAVGHQRGCGRSTAKAVRAALIGTTQQQAISKTRNFMQVGNTTFVVGAG